MVTYYGGESNSPFHYNDEFLYKEILSYMNQSSNLILSKSQSLPVTKRLNPNSVLFKVNQNNPNSSVCCQEKFSINPSLNVGF